MFCNTPGEALLPEIILAHPAGSARSAGIRSARTTKPLKSRRFNNLLT
jgi:hypothetical protein